MLWVMRSLPNRLATGLLVVGALAACQGAEAPAEPEEVPMELGAQDGFDLPATDLERVAVGTVAPDFYLETYAGEPMSLSEHRGKNVILVFYRGHW